MAGIPQSWGQVSAVDRAEPADERAAETALLRALRAGDLTALDRLLVLHERGLFALCYGLLGHAQDAEDAVQETFLRALRALPGYRGEATFRTWLFRIALHLCLRWKRSRLPTEPWDEARPPVAPESASPEAIAVRRLQIEEVLAHLLPRYRIVLILKEREGWSIAEIAAGLGWSERRVEHELSRARRALAEWRRGEEE
jgi:RNA polymerase sigma-70 factor (ECF subfamily)